MRPLTPHAMTTLLAEHAPPCISIYQPTHRTYPDSQQDQIRYRNLLRQTEELLRQRYPGSAVRSLLEKFHPLADDMNFWIHRQDGLAVFASPDLFETYDLQRPVGEQVVVAESFHVKPLLRRMQTADRYQVLALTRSRVKIYEGNRDALDEIDLRGVPATIEEALSGNSRITKPEQAPGGASTGERKPGGPNTHGLVAPQPAGNEVVQLDTDRFFREVDRAVWEYHSRPTGLPLILAALADNQPIFRRISHNQNLLADGIHGNPETMSIDELRQAAWKIVEPHQHARVRQLIDQYHAAKNRGLATDDLREAAMAAKMGRVGTLMIDADRHLPGTLDATTGEPRSTAPDTAMADDMLDDLGEVVLRMKGEVLVLPSNVMPTQTGLAAVYRY